MDECDKSGNISAMFDEDGICKSPPGEGIIERNTSNLFDSKVPTGQNENSDHDHYISVSTGAWKNTIKHTAPDSKNQLDNKMTTDKNGRSEHDDDHQYDNGNGISTGARKKTVKKTAASNNNCPFNNEVTTDQNGNSHHDDHHNNDDGSGISTGARKKTVNQTASNGTKNETIQTVFSNVRSLSNLASTYKLELFEKNLLIIFNFNKIYGYKERCGTKNDADELEKTFKMYRFEVEREGNEDLTRNELLKKLDELDNRDFTEYGCVAIAVMSHGTFDGWIMAKDMSFNEMEIIDRMKTRSKPTLVTKPVVLIIQACRGKNNPKGVNVTNHLIEMDHKESHHYYLPIETDILVIHSSYIGKPAFRPPNGSWFIQTLCKKIRELAATEDLESIMIEVKREIACNKYLAFRKTEFDEDIEYHKQVPTMTSTLIRKLYLFNKVSVPVKLSVNDNVKKELPPIQNVIQVNRGQSAEECACLLDHFDYLKKLLSIYVTENKFDTQARFLLEHATMTSIDNMKSVRYGVISISSYLRDRLRNQPHIKKYMYLYGDCNSNNMLLPPQSQDISVDTDEEETQASTVAPLMGAQSIINKKKKANNNKKFIIKYMFPILTGILTYAVIHVAHNTLRN